MGRSKIVLNTRVTPGTHERVFTSMLCGALCLSDRNEANAALFKDGEQIAFYDWTAIPEAPKMAGELLGDNGKGARMAFNGLEAARNGHTWSHRADSIMKALKLEPRL